MSNSFSAFYDTKAELLKSDGSEFDAVLIPFKTINADVQFSSAQIADTEFGFKYEKSARLYCASSDAEGVCEGDFVRVGGITYRIEHIENRNMGALLKLRSTSDERTAV